jgi:hypothetical protein
MEFEAGFRKQNVRQESLGHMMLAITWQWVSELTLVLCLFGAACIVFAANAGESSEGDGTRLAKRKAADRNSAARRRTSDDGDQRS